MTKIIGVLPAAGLGSRLHPLPYPKELLPIFFTTDAQNRQLKPRVAAEYSLRAMEQAGICQCLIIISERKLEIIRYFGDGKDAQMNLAYLAQTQPLGLPHAIDLGFDWLVDHYTCLALPDTIFNPSNAIDQICQEIIASQADLVLGVFPTEQPERLGPVRFDADGWVSEVLDKPQKTDLYNTWGVGIWSSRFTRFMHEKINVYTPEEQVIGHMFNQAVQSGLKVRAVFFAGGKYTDLGTPEGWSSLIFQDDLLPENAITRPQNEVSN